MGLCATKKAIENDEDFYDEIDEESILESMSHIDDYAHVKYETQQDMLDRFDFEKAKVLSEGEIMDVYYVKYKNFQDHFVCKVKKLSNDSKINTFHESENLMILAKVPYINRIRNTFEVPQQYFLMLEKYYGLALDEVLMSYIEIKERGMPEEVCKFILKGILDAVRKMHKLGVVHRQLSLEHIMFKSHEEYLNEIETKPDIGIISFNKSIEIYSKEKGLEADMDAMVGCLGYVAPEIQQVEMGTASEYNFKCDI